MKQLARIGRLKHSYTQCHSWSFLSCHQDVCVIVVSVFDWEQNMKVKIGPIYQTTLFMLTTVSVKYEHKQKLILTILRTHNVWAWERLLMEQEYTTYRQDNTHYIHYDHKRPIITMYTGIKVPVFQSCLLSSCSGYFLGLSWRWKQWAPPKCSTNLHGIISVTTYIFMSVTEDILKSDICI
jgi:hypothetical protein